MYLQYFRGQKDLFRLQQRASEKISISVGDDANNVRALKVRKRKHRRSFAEN